jgi:hypothetical protein
MPPLRPIPTNSLRLSDTALPKAAPPGLPTGEHFPIRHDTVDQFGKLTLRYASRLHHLGIGRAHAGTKVLILITATTITVIAQPTHQLIATHTIDPDRNYWRNQQKPRPMAGESVTDDATHL